MPSTWSSSARGAADADVAAQAFVLKVAKALIGPAWTKFFGNTDPSIADIVPRQVVLALERQLRSLGTQIQAGQDVSDQADSNFEAIKQASKRARLEPAPPSVPRRDADVVLDSEAATQEYSKEELWQAGQTLHW